MNDIPEPLREKLLAIWEKEIAPQAERMTEPEWEQFLVNFNKELDGRLKKIL